MRLSSASSAWTRAEGERPAHASQPALETPGTRAIAAIGKCAWFSLMNRKIPTARTPVSRKPDYSSRENVALQLQLPVLPPQPDQSLTL